MQFERNKISDAAASPQEQREDRPSPHILAQFHFPQEPPHLASIHSLGHTGDNGQLDALWAELPEHVKATLLAQIKAGAAPDQVSGQTG